VTTSLFPIARGLVYLAGVVDWYTLRVLSLRSITIDTAFCLEAVEEALTRYGKPDILNFDPGRGYQAEPLLVNFPKIAPFVMPPSVSDSSAFGTSRR
jgi:hypothetical protein